MTEKVHKIDEAARLIGPEAYRKLLAALGGRRIFVPAKAGQDHFLTQAIGQEAADKLCGRFSGDSLDLPSGARRRALIRQALAAGVSKVDIAKTYFVSERYVYKVQEDEGASEPEAKQLRLF